MELDVCVVKLSPKTAGLSVAYQQYVVPPSELINEIFVVSPEHIVSGFGEAVIVGELHVEQPATVEMELDIIALQIVWV
jgi:hypothetical protein